MKKKAFFILKKKTRCTSSELLVSSDHESAKANSENDSMGEALGQDTQGWDTLWREDLWSKEGMIFDQDDESISTAENQDSKNTIV